LVYIYEELYLHKNIRTPLGHVFLLGVLAKNAHDTLSVARDHENGNLTPNRHTFPH